LPLIAVGPAETGHQDGASSFLSRKSLFKLSGAVSLTAALNVAFPFLYNILWFLKTSEGYNV
jgi:hypothetical protein